MVEERERRERVRKRDIERGREIPPSDLINQMHEAFKSFPQEDILVLEPREVLWPFIGLLSF